MQGRRGGGFGRAGCRGLGGGYTPGPGGTCVCPTCGTQIPHTAGIPCHSQQCPHCGSKMIRIGNRGFSEK